MTTPLFVINPELDLVIDRVLDAPASRLWRGWTEPALIEKWFTPPPWRTVDVSVDLRPGGAFNSTMLGPNGERNESAGCYLEVVHERRLVWTDALSPGFRPTAAPFMTAIILFTPEGDRTRYQAIARHANPETQKQHADMGFHEGWGTVTTQLEALAQSL